MYAKVIVEIGVKNVDRTFDYLVPREFHDLIQVGMRVKVPFGKQQVEGFVMSLSNENTSERELKNIISLVDEFPVLNDEMLSLGQYIADYTLCSLISAYQVMLPKALKAQNKTNLKIKTKKKISLNLDINQVNQYLEKCRFKGQKEILHQLINDKILYVNSLDSSLKTLFKHGLIAIQDVEEYRYKHEINQTKTTITLNDEQKKVVAEVTDHLDQNQVYLLYGVTGSGKTEVYINIINQVISMKKEAIMLVPEISLTPQIVNRFINRFGEMVAILHSGLSDSERYDEYRKIRDGKVKIVVGARSAVFAPFTNLGCIIIDEEHTTTYKQDNHPRYNAKDVAIWRGNYHHCPVILGSATPNLETFARAGNKVYKLLTLTKRANSGAMPKVKVVDMKEEVKKGNYIFSELLLNKIEEKLSRHEQVILLLNRRGYSSMLTCSNCGEVFKCPRCDISLTYHKTSDMMRCHYCGYALKRQTKCLKCGCDDIKNYGLGTEKLEEELSKLFSNNKVIRMDMDTTAKKGAHQKIIEDFGNHKYDLLLGTQMIAKGLDFPLVTLVGVINADMSLNVPDFRSAERTFQLLCQVSGRAGRSNSPGEVVIQAYNSEHYSINYAQNHDYLSFYKEEMKIRKLLKYSPYYYLTLVKISSKDYELGFQEANKIGNYLKTKLGSDYTILGPTMANIFKINNIYNFQCIIKYRDNTLLNKVLKKIDERYKLESKVNVEIDVDPQRL